MSEPFFNTIDPLMDTRWDELVKNHPDASIFHHSGWLRALTKTYGFRPMVLTSTPDGSRLSNGIPFCEVRSFITGARLISLPFSDHCQPLLNGRENTSELIGWLASECKRRKWHHVELRPLSWAIANDTSISPSQSFWFHTLSLEPSLNHIFQNLHKDSLQRRIRRAEREGLVYEKGCSEQLLDAFYGMLSLTRKRHGLPPQPKRWFHNLISFLRPNVQIRLARKDAVPIAAIFTLLSNDKVIYKYGGSDERFHHFAGMPFLFWKLIEESKAEGAKEIDFGRTDLDNKGLTRFKDQFGTERKQLIYLQCRSDAATASAAGQYLNTARRIFSLLPTSVSRPLGVLLYKHIA